MASATLTRWLLRAFADNWPGGLPQSGDTGGPLYLTDRDDSVILDVDTTTSPTTLTRDRHTEEFDLTTGNVLGVALSSGDRLPAGLGGSEVRGEPVLTVRIEGAHEKEHGHLAHAEEFKSLYRTAMDVVQNIDNGTLQDAPDLDFYVADPGDTNPQMSNYVDYFRYDFEVQGRAYGTV